MGLIQESILCNTEACFQPVLTIFGCLKTLPCSQPQHTNPGGGGGALVFEVGYHPLKKIHVIRVVFQHQAMYARTSFRGAKTCKIGKKGVFLVIQQIFERT